MWVFLIFVLPLLLLAAAWSWGSRTGARGPIVLLAAVPALVTAVGIVFLVAQSGSWRDRSEIAWLGVDAPTLGGSVSLGGPPAGTNLRWPTGFAWPRVELTEAGPGAVVQVFGGGGLVEVDGVPVNGTVIPTHDVTVRQFRVRVVAAGLTRPRYLQVRATQPFALPAPTGWWDRLLAWTTRADPDPPLAEFPLRVPASRVLSIAGRVARPVLTLRQSARPEDLDLALALEEWAAFVRVYITESDVRLLDEAEFDATARAVAERLPLSLTVRWPRRVLRATVWRTGGRLHVGFLPPWRVASPLPPRAEAGRAVPLTITRTPVPGDHVFELPLGRATTARVTMHIVDDPRRGEVFEGTRDAERNILVPPGTPRNMATRAYNVDRVRSTSCFAVGSARPCLAIVQDVLHPAALVEALAVAVICFVAALVICDRLLRALAPLAWTLALLLASLWNLLALRLLLALRYTLDPSGLDALSVEGVASAVGALIIIPPALAGAAAIYLERFEVRSPAEARKRFYVIMIGLVATCLLGVQQVSRALRLWPNLSPSFDPGIPAGLEVLVAGVLVAGVGAACYSVLFRPVQRSRWWLLSASNLPLSFLSSMAQLWKRSRDLDAKRTFWMPSAAALIVLIAVFVAAARAAGDLKFATELLYPLFVGVPCVIFWLGALHAFQETSPRRRLLPGWRQLVVPTALFVCLPIGAPTLLGDPGALYSMLAVLFTTGVLLAVSRHRRFGVAIIVGCGLTIVVLALGVRHVSDLPTPVVGLFDRGAARVTAYVYGSDVQRMLPFSRALADVGDGLPADALRGALEHPWESGAIVYRGGWLGLGYAQAPNRRSNVPQDVLQYDSTYSFFIAGDHGLVGAFSLLLLYLVPFLALVPGARQYFDTGYALAMIVAAWLVLEAVIHAGVNVGSLPFTGRNLPWLSVNSAADLLRWTAMALLMVHAALWRTTGSGYFSAKDVSLVVGNKPTVPAVQAAAARGPAAASPVAVAAPPIPVMRSVFHVLDPVGRAILATVGFVVFFVLTLVIVPSVRAAQNDEEFGVPFTWRPFLDEVQRFLDDGMILWDAGTWRLDAAPLASEGLVLDGTSLLEQEIARFNSLPRDVKADVPISLEDELRGVRSLADYDALFARLAERERLQLARRPALFRVSQRTVLQDNGTLEALEFPLVDTSRNAMVSFGPEQRPEDLPVVRLRPALPAHPEGELAIGPAWVSGRWRTAYISDARLPWVETLASAVEVEWSNRGRESERFLYSALTIDGELQQRARAFVATKGRDRHAELLASGAQRADPVRALPPRVALSVLAIPSGEVLALGGWPSMSASGAWQATPDGVLPPSPWLRDHAPRALAYRYLGDRNFDPIEMGSATKPLWAAAALRIHPQLNRELRTRGPKGDESAVFGIPIAPPELGWHVSATDWIPFRTYLARSDNRYHVRLGFLTLAESADGLPVADAASASTEESLSSRGGQPVPWQRTPLFNAEIGFSSASSRDMRALHTTRVASELQQLFGVSVRPDDFRSFRRSFWSLREADDRVGTPPSLLPDQFLEISPSVPALRLDTIHAPRQFVNLLLGGGTNRWANVDFAAAFSTAVTGHPVVARAVPGTVELTDQRATFPVTAAQVREALNDVVVNGTATTALRGSLAWIRAAGLSIYAKTGTLSTDRGQTETSRLAVSIVRWRNETQGDVDRGLTLSLVVERAATGYAAQWLGEFIAANRDVLLRYLAPAPNP